MKFTNFIVLFVCLGSITLLTGCVGQLASVVRELKDDPATVHAKITTPWGTAEIDRSNNAATPKP